MQRPRVACFMIIFITLQLSKFEVSGSIFCPSVFEKGIPFDIYGGPLFPVVLYDSKDERFFAPFWAEISSHWAQNLINELRRTNASICLLDELPFCEEAVQNITQKMLTERFGTDDWEKPVDALETFKMDLWGTTNLDDLKDPKLVRTRRTIVVMCLHWCHGMLALPEEERPVMEYLCPNPCKQPGLCMGVGDVHGSCQLTGEGFFQHQYICKCKPGSVWNAVTGTCRLDDPCKRKKSPLCFPEGTELCSYDFEKGVSHTCNICISLLYKLKYCIVIIGMTQELCVFQIYSKFLSVGECFVNLGEGGGGRKRMLKSSASSSHRKCLSLQSDLFWLYFLPMPFSMLITTNLDTLGPQGLSASLLVSCL